MLLPDFLIADDGGFVHVRGHRIGLHHIIRQYSEGESPEMLAARFPTLSLALIHKVIAFYLEHLHEVDTYIAAHDQEIERQAAAAPPTPSLAELRKRFEAMRASVRTAGSTNAK